MELSSKLNIPNICRSCCVYFCEQQLSCGGGIFCLWIDSHHSSTSGVMSGLRLSLPHNGDPCGIHSWTELLTTLYMVCVCMWSAATSTLLSQLGGCVYFLCCAYPGRSNTCHWSINSSQSIICACVCAFVSKWSWVHLYACKAKCINFVGCYLTTN